MRYQDPSSYPDVVDADARGGGRQASGPGRARRNSAGYSGPQSTGAFPDGSRHGTARPGSARPGSAHPGNANYSTGDQRPPWDYENYSNPRGSETPVSDFPTQTDGFRAATGGFPTQADGFSRQSGGFPAQTGGLPRQTGGFTRQSGGFPAQTGGFPAHTGDFPAQTGGFTRQTGGLLRQTGGFTRQTGDFPAQTGGFTRQTGDFPAQAGGLLRQTGGFAAQADKFLANGRRATPDSRRDGATEADDGAPGGRRGNGLLTGAISGFLAAGTTLGVANLAAAFVRPQASPIVAVGGELMAYTPSALTNFVAEKLGQNDMTTLLLSTYFTIALIALVIGMIAWRQLPAGVAGIGLFGLYAAFVAYTRPASHATDVIPSLVGSLAGIIVLVALTQWTRVRQRSVGARDVVGPLATERSGWAA